MKLITGILALGVMVGGAAAQNPDIIQNTRDTLRNVQAKQTIDQNAVLAASGQQGSSPAAKPAAPAAKPVQPAPAPKSAVVITKPTANTPKAAVIVPSAKPKVGPKTEPKTSTISVAKPEEPKPAVAVEDKKVPVEPKKEEKTYSSVGKRDPFISPVISRSMSGSGCNTGKRCLAVDQIALTGIVKSDSGMIAVVVNALNKAYFLRENDPVFNGYVVKITGDTIVFKETIQDKLGKPFEREVTKKITAPAV
jgi:Tfp pilus assembly protein PilP